MSKNISSGAHPPTEDVVVLGPRDADGSVFLHDARHRPMMVYSHRHDEWEVNLITRGWCEYLVEGRRVRFSLDTLAWLLPSHRHIMLDRAADLRMWVGVFRPSVARRLARDTHHAEWRPWLRGTMPDAPPMRVLSETKTRHIAGLCNQLAGEAMETARCNAGVAWLMAECWDAYRTAEDLPIGSHLHPGVERAARLLVDHPQLDDFDDLARRCNLSRPHLSRLFQKQVGCSLTDFRNRQRVRRFTELLGRGGRMNLTEAAYAAGFGSYTQCFRVVRRITGTSPRKMTKGAGFGDQGSG